MACYYLLAKVIQFFSFFLKTLLVGGSYWEILAHNVQEEEVGTRTGNRKKTQRCEKV